MWERGADAWAWARVRAAGERRKRALRSEREVRAGQAVREKKGRAEEKGTGPDAGGKGGDGGLGCLGWLGPVGWAWRREKKRMAMGRLGFGSLGWVVFLVLGLGWVFFLFSFANLTQTIGIQI